MGRRWRWGVPLVALAFLARFVWVLAVPTVPVGDFATYRESANYLLEFGSLDHGFIYMPGFVLMLAGVAALGGDLLAQKMLGVVLGGAGGGGDLRHHRRLARRRSRSDRDGDRPRRRGAVAGFAPARPPSSRRCSTRCGRRASRWPASSAPTCRPRR